MDDAPRKKSPRAPSIALNEAIERALKIYDKEGRHAAPADVIAQDLGYKSANNGAALAVIASMRYYGLLEKVQAGKLAVSKDIEDYKFAPSEELKSDLQIKWLKAPPVFAELLEQYGDRLPSDVNIRYALIQREFNPVTAESVMSVFKQSVEFSRFFERKNSSQIINTASISTISEPTITRPDESESRGSEVKPSSSDHDRIPVRLSGGRRAWLEIPTPFYQADKIRLKAQIDLLLVEDDDSDR